MYPFKQTFRTDIFCRVIDNFGDAGVLWRLSRDLLSYGHAVRLIIDDLNTLARMVPGLNPLLSEQVIENIVICHWPESWNAPDGTCPLTPAQWVIEGFACQIPPSYEQAMAQCIEPVHWINLDYLSAEDWVQDYHGLPSLHPNLPLTKTFFFPGFTEKTGGLIIEQNYQARQRSFDRSQWLKDLGGDASLPTLFFFVYPYGPIKELAQALAQYHKPLQILLSATESGNMLFRELKQLKADHIRCITLPFMAQSDFDLALWACDLAFIRGEDSAARAQLAGCAFIWHIYHQEDGAHRIKLNALTDKINQALDYNPLLATWCCFQSRFNEGYVDLSEFHEILDQLETLKFLLSKWSLRLHKNGPLAHKLAQCVEKR